MPQAYPMILLVSIWLHIMCVYMHNNNDDLTSQDIYKFAIYGATCVSWSCSKACGKYYYIDTFKISCLQ